MKRSLLLLTLIVPLGTLLDGSVAETPKKPISHPPLRTAPASDRPLDKSPTYFADPAKGDDRQDGSKAKPWRTINHAVEQLRAGDTLCLRGGTYYENVRVSLAGRKDAPITVRSHPGEQAVLDGGLREFFEAPTKSWEPVEKGAKGEYRSTRTYPNRRHVLGSFGDSMVGLVSYYHAIDLRADEEFLARDPKTKDFKPVYCGPGVWYDVDSGRIHARLAHTSLPDIDNYKGETDPRKLPLVIAPFRSVPVRLDGARHVRFQDLVIRGGGYDTVVLDQSDDIEFDNVTVWCGSYGLRATGVRRLRFHRSGLYGSIPPWLSRADSSLRSRPGSGTRDIARLNTHALLVPEAGREFSVYAFPMNDDWDISHSEFSDASDGLYLGGVNMRFHHNLVENFQDDGLYLSPMYPRHLYLKGGATLHLYQNVFRRALTMLAFGGPEGTRDTIYFYRNVIDLRAPVNVGRPASKDAKAATNFGHTMSDHGSPPWPAMNTYHNTFFVRSRAAADLNLPRGAIAERPRRVFNNILVHGVNLPNYVPSKLDHAHADGNLFWQPGLDAKRKESYFAAYRTSAAFKDSKKRYAPGIDASSLVADPKFVKAEAGAKSANDYRLQAGSPAIDAGVAIPDEWPDPLRKQDRGKPDIGALPLGAAMLKVGRSAAR